MYKRQAHVEVSYADANDAHWMYCDPAEGRLPQEGTDAVSYTHLDVYKRQPKDFRGLAFRGMDGASILPKQARYQLRYPRIFYFP